MKSFLEIQFKNQYHSPETPKSDFLIKCSNPSLSPTQDNELNKYVAELKHEKHEVPIIFIGADTSGLASGAGKVKLAIETELQKLNIDAKIVLTGGMGFGAIEPTVDIKLPNQDRIIYCEITYKDVPELLKTTLIDKRIYSKKVFGKYGKTEGSILNIYETPFFKNQKRVVLKNCGIIDPN